MYSSLHIKKQRNKNKFRWMQIFRFLNHWFMAHKKQKNEEKKNIIFMIVIFFLNF